MYTDSLSGADNFLTDTLVQAHANSWETIGAPGDYFSGADRVAMVHASREALTCLLCEERKAALSPFAVDGEHETSSSLPAVIIDVIHRIRTDPGRLTKEWFDRLTLSNEEYVEVVSVVASAVIIDTLHNALGLGVPPLPRVKQGLPRRKANAAAVMDGAWVPILNAPQVMSDTGLPEVPNITRALGLVPSANSLFFGTFRPHYALKDLPLSISQAQAEFVASRVSAINECFY